MNKTTTSQTTKHPQLLQNF